MNTPFHQPTKTTLQRIFLNHAAFGLVAFLSLHLLHTTSAPQAEKLPVVFTILKAVATVYYTVSLMKQPPAWLQHHFPKVESSRVRFRLPRRWGVVVSLLLVLMTITYGLPAHAAFYSAAEAFMSSSFPQAATAVPLIFNALRAIFLIYTAIALISVLQSFRQGDEWLSVARSPAAVVVVVALGDVLTTIIVA